MHSCAIKFCVHSKQDKMPQNVVEGFYDATATSTMNDKVSLFKQTTHQMNTYNEIYNVNTYLQKITLTERSRLNRTNDTLSSAIIKTKQDYMMNERVIEFTNFRLKLVYISIIFLCIILILTGLQLMKILSALMTGPVIAFLLILYLIITVSLMMGNKDRKQLNWNQYYWPEMKKADLTN